MTGDAFDDERRGLLRLHLTERVGAGTYRRLLEHFGSLEAVFAAGERELQRVEGVGAKAAARLADAAAERDVDAELEAAQRAGARILTWLDDEYPEGLKSLDNPPLALYVRGRLERRDLMSVAVVGSRQATHYGLMQARRLAGGLASVGVTVVSGLARGVDEAAHRAALAAKGRTIAVLGSGLAKVYPAEHRALADAIAEQGAVASEFPMTAPPARGNFPYRNRLISALSLGVVVVEAALRSGALITAKWANEQGKPVFAVPGPVDSPTSRGPHDLIRHGAVLVESCGDVLEEIGPLASLAGQAPDEPALPDARELAMTERERAVFNCLSPSQPISIDEVIETSGLSASEVASTLLILEIKRCAQSLPGQRYVKKM